MNDVMCQRGCVCERCSRLRVRHRATDAIRSADPQVRRKKADAAARWRREHPDKVREYQRAYRRRARQAMDLLKALEARAQLAQRST